MDNLTRHKNATQLLFFAVYRDRMFGLCDQTLRGVIANIKAGRWS
jgi:hypothetical protein